jgi:hypothetical protein
MTLRFTNLALIACLAIPAFGQADLTANNVASYEAETAEQRRHLLFAHTIGSAAPYLAAAADAGLDQISNKPKEWGQGAQGYGRRVGSRFGRLTMATAFSEGTEAALGLDSRYIPSRSRGFMRRAGYAIGATFFAYDSEGRKRFDPGPMIGSFSSGILATRLWYPNRYDPFSKGLNLGVSVLIAFPIGNLLREFRPELKPILDKVKLGGMLPNDLK